MNGANNQDDLKIFDLDFADLYQFQHIQFALADLISKDDKGKPIIAAHPIGCNNISELPESIISQEDKEKINQVLKQDGSAELLKNEAKKQLKELSESAVKEEFDTMFALVDARKRPVLYIRWMPKDNALFLSSRGNAKGHHVCLYFFHDHNNKKSILIANPNGIGITEVSEANVISSYLKKNPAVKIYQSQDYTQFDNTTCGPGALVLLRMLYNMSKRELKSVLEKGEEKTFERNKSSCFLNIDNFNDVMNLVEKLHGMSKQEVGKFLDEDKENVSTGNNKLNLEACDDFDDAVAIINQLRYMKEDEVRNFLEEGKKNAYGENNKFNFTAIKLGDDALQKEIGKIPQKNTPEAKDVDQKLRHADYATAKACKEHNNAIKSNDCVAIALADIPFDQELVKDLSEDQAILLSKLLLSGTPLLTPEQILQAQQKREEIFGIKKKGNVKFKILNERESSKSKLHNNAQDHKPAEKSEFSKILATTAAFIGCALLGSAIFIDMKKEFKIGGIVLSSVMLISAVTCFFLPGKTPDSKMTIDIKTPLIEKTTTTVQLP